MKKITTRNFSVCLLLYLFAGCAHAAVVVDDSGQRHTFSSPPVRVVSLVPSATEILCALDVSDTLAGVTYHDTHLPEIADIPIVGGAFTPQFSVINALCPDLLIVAPRDAEKARSGRGKNPYPILVWDDGASLSGAEARTLQLGTIFQKTQNASRLVEKNAAQRALVSQKISRIPPNQRQKTIRLMLGKDGQLLTPGEDSFQTELIRAAGGIPPKMGNGRAVPVTLEKWRDFNPDVVFGCGDIHRQFAALLNQDGWKDVPAVKNSRIYTFPCVLTCRAATHTGDFSAWLASTLYGKAFADPENQIYPREILSERSISIDLPHVKNARIVETRIMDFVHQTLLVNFFRPQAIVSTASGCRDGIRTVGNAYSPPPTWGIYHERDVAQAMGDLLDVLKLDANQTDLMLTGADMKNLVVKTAGYRDMKVVALITAGVEGNALRTGKDTGAWYEPGTINILVMTNHHLSPQAAARSLVTITEAKTAALWDMDIRSVQTGAENPATGTGTDSIVVVAGEGVSLSGSGGHTKMGELIAEAVYKGVQDAIFKQNGKGAVRSVFERLAERGITPYGLTGGPDCPCQEDGNTFQSDLEAILLAPPYQGFLQASFSLSDAHQMGQLTDLLAFETWAIQVAGDIAGRPVEEIESIIGYPNLPPVLEMALNALGTGVKYRKLAVSDLAGGK
ncbi:adenosylcobinamide amidohydrolase [Desulfosarcina sp. OttesenSCG-928-A07]|nr:adenosylcobinamide amidohydrolase [Desulfosarcina sp. OttesenSCG-928-G17]MDL2330262.1 adenosylcobinamide amidohydrolase [Desulfosarcina sp. OttesenSCG-928-A07]